MGPWAHDFSTLAYGPYMANQALADGFPGHLFDFFLVRISAIYPAGFVRGSTVMTTVLQQTRPIGIMGVTIE